MRYLYGNADEKFVKTNAQTSSRDVNRLSKYKFRLSPMIRGKVDEKEFDKQDIALVYKCTPDTLLNLCAKIVDHIDLPLVYTWTIEDVCKWLRGYGYRQYQNTFRGNLITGRTLLLLDASALSAMNIKDFNHIKDITYGIRSLFHYDMTKFGRSLTLYPEFPYEIYKILRIKTGAKYENTRCSDLWRQLQMIRKKEPNHTHWDILERWLNFDKDPEYKEIFAGTRRCDLFRCKAIPIAAPIAAKRQQHCFCLPPCECQWTDMDRRPPWRFKCLPHISPDKEFVEVCQCCIPPPCTCHWSSKKFRTHDVLTCIQLAFPQKYSYGIYHTQNRSRYRKYDQTQTYRLSML